MSTIKVGPAPDAVNPITRQRDVLLDIVLKVVSGLDDGSVRAQPMLDTSDEEAESWPMFSLREWIDKKLAEVNLQIKTKP